MPTGGRRISAVAAAIAAVGGGAAIATAAAPNAPATYYGLTSQSAPVTLALSPDRAHVSYEIEWTARCGRGGTIGARTSTTPGTGIAVRRDGRFAYRSTATGVVKGFGALTGPNTIRGRVVGSQVRGTFVQRLHYLRRGRRVACTTRRVRWSATLDD